MTRSWPPAAALLTLLGAGACASGGFAPGEPAPLIARQHIDATAPGAPVQVTFAWALRDREARFNGEGVARVQPSYRGRLDLFGPRGETYIVAALARDALTLPPGAESDQLPPPALLWAALGVLYPPEGATLVGTSTSAGETRFEYARGNERWRFRLQGDMLRYAEWQGPGDGRRTVELEGESGSGMPQRAFYRDWLAFRELELTLQEIEQVDGFPDEVFDVPR